MLTGLTHTNPDDLDIELVPSDQHRRDARCRTCVAATTSRTSTSPSTTRLSTTCRTQPAGCTERHLQAEQRRRQRPRCPRPVDRHRARGVQRRSTPTARGSCGWSTTTPRSPVTWRAADPASPRDRAVLDPIPGHRHPAAASPYPFPIPVSGKTGKVADVNLVLPGLTQQPIETSTSSWSPRAATKVMVMSDACGASTRTTTTLTRRPGCRPSSRRVLPVPAAPTGATRGPERRPCRRRRRPARTSTMAAFNGLSPNGTWKLFVRDDGSAPTAGGFVNDPTLVITTTDVTARRTRRSPRSRRTRPRRRRRSSSPPTRLARTSSARSTTKKFKPCSRPLKLKHLKFGKHKIQVRAIDAAGNVDPTPLRGKWKIIKPS